MRALLTLLVAALLVVPVAAQAQFPGSNPDESVRENTPNDPDFDRCEPDGGEASPCTNVFDEEYERFGFAPSGSRQTALYVDSSAAQRQVEQNETAGIPNFPPVLGLPPQVSGVSVDRAWKRSTGSPEVEIAILDTGIRYNRGSLRTKIALNAEELVLPEGCLDLDCDGDGAFTVDDYAGDSRVDVADGNDEADTVLDASDLIAVFSDGIDDDANGFVDDIAGWDFFDDDNDPYDSSSHASASNHGTGRAEEAGQQTNDGSGGTGLCPQCRIMPLRVWDTFVVPTENFALATAYAADNGVEVVEAALGGLTNPRFAREAMRKAYAENGVFFAVVSSDLNTANHNFPTTYDEAMMVAGTVSDVEGLGESNAEVGGFLGGLGINLPTNAPITTWFRNSGTTQYGGHGHIAMPGTTGSQATGQAAGAAGLVISHARELGVDLRPNETKQLLTMTAEDVLPLNTGAIGIPDPAQEGWDQHFGYGRPDLGLALQEITEKRIPPQALITSPDWFAPFPLGDGQPATVDIAGRLSAPRSGAGFTYELQWAPGIEPAEGDFQTIRTGAGSGEIDGVLGTVDLAVVRAALDALPNGGATFDPTAPAPGPGDADPNEPAFTVRVQVTDDDGTVGEDRKVLFAYHDDGLVDGWLKRLETGGEASQRLWDLDGDNRLDVVLADSSGELTVYRHDGTPLESFNGGEPVRSEVLPGAHTSAPFFADVEPPRAPFRTPAIGDVDGDLEADIVDAAGEKVYAWDRSGQPLDGFPVRLDPAFSDPSVISRDNHVKRGFVASPVLADLDGDGVLDIIQAGLDQHVYVWDGEGNELDGFPVKLATDGLPGAEILATPAVGDITGDGKPEIVVPTQEFDDAAATPDPPTGPDVAGFIREGVTNLAAQALGGSGRTYAIDTSGAAVPGWPVTLNGIIPDALPFVAPGVDHALGDFDGDGEHEIVGNLATGDVKTFDGDGSDYGSGTLDSVPAASELVDKTKVLNLFETPIVADMSPLPGLEIFKGGVTLVGLINLGVAVGQNFPYNHALQGWSADTGAYLPNFPQAVEDYQLLSSPAVADVAGGDGPEVVVGTGLYHLRSFDSTGVEDPDFPKFTGGWLFAVPAFGDVDGDGNLDIATMTREGNAFVWATDRPACAGNDQWWTSRHDERSTAAHGTDTRPPNVPGDLAISRDGDEITVSFTRPGDDWACGTPAKLRITTGGAGIDGPADGTELLELDATDAQVTRTFAASELGERVGVAYRDEAGNWGLAATAAVPATPVGTPTPTPDPTQTPGDGQPPGQGQGQGPGATPTPPPGPESLAAPVLSGRKNSRASGRIFLSVRSREGTVIEAQQRRRPARRWKPLVTRAGLGSLRFKGRQGHTYEFRARSRASDGRVSPWSKRGVTVPLDQTRRRIALRGWRRDVDRGGAYGRSVAVARRAGAAASLRFKGRRVSVFGARGVRVLLDGERVRKRNVKMPRGRHVLRIEARRRGARFDAVSIWR